MEHVFIGYNEFNLYLSLNKKITSIVLHALKHKITCEKNKTFDLS